MELSDAGRKILGLIVVDIRTGRFNPSNAIAFLGYKEVHDRLGLERIGFNWGSSLAKLGLADLAYWVRDENLPAITGLIVDEIKRKPGKGYFQVYKRSEDEVAWWCDQVRASIKQDWSRWVPDQNSVLLHELALDSRTFVDGNTRAVTQEVRERCNALRERGKALFRDADGVLRCKICGWHKPSDGRISGDIVELHHLDPVCEAPTSGRIVTVAEIEEFLLPVCPNCHRLVHARRGGGQFDSTTLQRILNVQVQRTTH